MKKFFLPAALAISLIACADMNPTQQRALTGTAAGAGAGAIIGAIGGNAALGAGIGAGAGLLGGLLVDQSRRSQDRAFQQGYAAGRHRPPPNPPR
jgi:osmotically inducible lipoprotein OsmB